ncbi:MAG: lipopolysaccharide biosynthesis protein [Burkholderiales bacterium]
MNLGHLIRSGVKWTMASRIAGHFIHFIFGVALARILVPADFGLLVTVQIFTGVAGFFASGGMAQALVRAKKVTPRHFQVVFTLQLMVGTAIYGLFFVSAPWIATWFHHPIYVDLLRVSALSFIIRPFLRIPVARLQRDMRYKPIAIANAIAMIVTGVSSVAMALMGLQVWALVFGGFIGTAVSIFMVMAVTRWLPGIRFDLDCAKDVAGFGYKISLLNFVEYLRTQTANFIISRTLGASTVGLYNKADSLAVMPRSTIVGTVNKVMFRALARAQDDPNLMKYLYFRTISLVNVYTGFFCILLWWLAEPLILIIYGEKWVPAAAPLEILVLTSLFVTGGVTSQILAVQNRLGVDIRIGLEVWTLTALGCVVGLQWGLIGAAWGVFAAALYGNVRSAKVGIKSVGGRLPDVLHALRPSLVLNGMVFAAFFLGDALAFADLRISNPALYVSGMTVVGGATYAACFLYLPIQALATEAQRWKKWLRLSRVAS